MADKKPGLLSSLIGLARRFKAGQKGFTLIEVLIAIALMGMVGASLLQGMSTVARGQTSYDALVEALIAGRAHVESIKQTAYDNSVTATPGPGYASLPAQRTVGNTIFDMQITAQQIDTGVQLVTVVVSNNSKEITRLQAYKVNR